ncbi:hypothetical protein CRP738_gp31 [Roseobacter phage CRP-738]|nr:hypothetical protein CRP738_gp31 [Roseobacter phage CRP-738]
MPTTNTNFSTLISAIDTKAQSLASSTTDPKDLVFLGKAIEAMTVPDTVSAIIDEGDTQVAAVQTEGSTQVAAVQAAGANYAALSGATFTGAVTGTDLTLSGNLTVNGTQTVINTATLDVADANITIADGAADSAAADGAGITIEGAGVNFQYSDSGKHMSLNTGLKVAEIKEQIGISVTTSGTLTMDMMDQAILFCNSAQLANRTINFQGNSTNTLDSIMTAGESMTAAALMTQGGTAYYLNTVQIDGTTVTPKWQGGSAPTGGNASGIDVYTFTIIKTAAATFTVLASQTQFA